MGRGDVLITDVALPDGDALDLLPRIKERRPDLPVIIMSTVTLLTAVKPSKSVFLNICQSLLNGVV